MILAAIDGACHRNGKPDCVSAGAAFIVNVDPSYGYTFKAVTQSEYNSTNQRGELFALREALKYISTSGDTEAHIITDSEYLFNTMHKEWIKKWAVNDWRLSSGDRVKNMDIWLDVYALYMKLEGVVDIIFYHIKGHCIPFGAVTADNLLDADCTGKRLYDAACVKYDKMYRSKQDKLEAAQDLSVKNNGYRLAENTLKIFVAMNITVDAIATKAVNKADA